MTRGAAATRPSPGPFHCVACRVYVTGTTAGHCPRCGWVPPAAPAVEDAPAALRGWTVALAALTALAVAAFLMAR